MATFLNIRTVSTWGGPHSISMACNTRNKSSIFCIVFYDALTELHIH